MSRRSDLPSVQKLHDDVATDVDDAVELIAGQPSIGERKKGDLADLFVYQFRSQGHLYLLSYTLEEVCSWFIWKPSAHTKTFIATSNTNQFWAAHRSTNPVF